MNTQVIKKMFNLKRFIVFGLLLFSFSNVFSAEHCSDQYFIDETLPNGSRWDMCWEHRDREGIVLHHVFYTPKNGARQQVLYQASIAQIHVPYDDNGARYHDISDFGIGGDFITNMTQAECKNGSLKQFSGKNVLCQQIESRHLAHYADSDKLHGDALTLFSNSKVGAYHYLPYWRFFDDGTIEPTMGATGRLQRHSTGHSDTGWPTNSNRTGIAHLHNFFWRLDFDLGTSGTDDIIEEFNFELNSGKRERTSTRFSTEKAREVNPSSYRSWRIIDGGSTNNNAHKKSYEILLEETGHKDKGPSTEPFTHNDFFVTKSDDCEKYASHNPTANGCKKNLAEFVNGENITGQDTIVWVGLTFYHMPRVEDAPHMDAHWNHFQIVPRDWHTVNPLGNDGGGGGPVNSAPSITNPGDQTNQVGDVINYLVTATDIDNDALNYTATGLPAGLIMNNRIERITGTITAEAIGANSVTVTATDGQLSDHASFNWQVTSLTSGNTLPVITDPGDQSSLVGDNINLIINATDSDSDTLVYSASGLVPGLVINSSTGIISGTISEGSDGNYNITVTVNDGTGSSNSNFTWTVGVDTREDGIQIDGNDTDWAQVRKYQDVPGENTSPVDIEVLQVTGDDSKVYIAYHDRQNIDLNNSWAWQVLIDTDYQTNTGLLYFDMGGDYMLVGDAIYKYAGDGQSWDWALLGNVTTAINGKFAELAIDRSIIGQSNKLKLTFYGANAYAGGTTNDFLFVNSPNISGSGNPRDGIVIDGISNDWAAGNAISDEPEADTSPVDYQSVWFEQDSAKVYFAYKNRTIIDFEKYWAWMVLIDSDTQLSSGINFYGEIGADFMLLGGDLYKYAGTGSDWNWTFVRKVSNVVNGDFAELAVNKSDLNNSNNYKIIYYGSNTYAGGAVDDRVKVIP